MTSQESWQSIRSSLRKYRVNKRKIGRISGAVTAFYRLGKAGVSVTFVGTSRMRSLNQKYRGKNRSTDVLSFPLIFDRRIRIGALPSAWRKVEPSFVDKSLGDVVISLPDAERNAKQIGQSLDREVCFLLVHGILHLCGLDHEVPRDEREMIEQQRKIMARLDRPDGALPVWRGCVRRRSGER